MTSPANITIWQSRNCPVCGSTHEQSTLFLPNSFDRSRITEFSYASRKDPEYMSFRLLRCNTCDVVYACESPDGENIHTAYHEAAYDSADEALLAARSYFRSLKTHLDFAIVNQGIAVEIGSGTGIFLEQIANLGFSQLIGIEPSQAAIAAATPTARPWLKEGIFKESDFTANSLSFICCFMTLEHVPDPERLITSCFRLLKPGGKVAFVTHDYAAWNNKILGKRSPIIDIEHLQLFNRTSMNYLLQKTGFIETEISSFSNTYRISYWNRLLPLPKFAKSLVATILRATRLGQIKLTMNVGNILSIAQKP